MRVNPKAVAVCMAVGILAVVWFSLNASHETTDESVSSATLQNAEARATPQSADARSDVLDNTPRQESSPGTESDVNAPDRGNIGIIPSGSACSPLALPKVSDIEIATCGPLDFVKQLTEELRDPGWASGMEARILDLVGGANGLDVPRHESECRMTACGVVLVFADQTDYWEQREAVNELTGSLGSLGFRQVGVSLSVTTDGKTIATIGLMRHAERAQLNERPTISALPSMDGLDIPLYGIDGVDDLHPARRLAAEVDDPSWSQAMESRVLDETAAALVGSAVVRLEAECRTTTCGVVFRYPPGTVSDVGGLEDELTEALGFERSELNRYPSQDGTLVAIYLENADRSGR